MGIRGLSQILCASIVVAWCFPGPLQHLSIPLASARSAGDKEASDSNRALRDEIAGLFAKLEQEQGLARLRDKITTSIDGAKIRGIDSYEYPILKFGMPAFDPKQLRAGRLPYYVTGDFDCDKKQDHAVLLSAPKKMLAVSLGGGRTLALPHYNGDVIEKGSPGRYPTAAGKGYGTPKPEAPKHFEALCDFITVRHWERSSYAVLYDPVGGQFRRVWTAD